MMFVKIMLAVCMLVGMSESGFCFFRELCHVGFLVAGESLSILL